MRFLPGNLLNRLTTNPWGAVANSHRNGTLASGYSPSQEDINRLVTTAKYVRDLEKREEAGDLSKAETNAAIAAELAAAHTLDANILRFFDLVLGFGKKIAPLEDHEIETRIKTLIHRRDIVRANPDQELIYFVTKDPRYIPEDADYDIARLKGNSFFARGLIENPSFHINQKDIEYVLGWKRRIFSIFNFSCTKKDPELNTDYVFGIVSHGKFPVTAEAKELAYNNPNSKYAFALGASINFELNQKDKDFIFNNPNTLLARSIAQYQLKIKSENTRFAFEHPGTNFELGYKANEGYVANEESIKADYYRVYSNVEGAFELAADLTREMINDDLVAFRKDPESQYAKGLLSRNDLTEEQKITMAMVIPDSDFASNCVDTLEHIPSDFLDFTLKKPNAKLSIKVMKKPDFHVTDDHVKKARENNLVNTEFAFAVMANPLSVPDYIDYYITASQPNSQYAKGVAVHKSLPGHYNENLEKLAEDQVYARKLPNQDRAKEITASKDYRLTSFDLDLAWKNGACPFTEGIVDHLLQHGKQEDKSFKHLRDEDIELVEDACKCFRDSKSNLKSFDYPAVLHNPLSEVVAQDIRFNQKPKGKSHLYKYSLEVASALDFKTSPFSTGIEKHPAYGKK